MDITYHWRLKYHKRSQDFPRKQADKGNYIHSADGIRKAVERKFAPINSKIGKRKVKTLTDLERFEVFARAIAAAAQDVNVTRPLWDGIQAIIQSASPASTGQDAVVSLIRDFHESLPENLNEYMNLLPGPLELQWALQNLYDTYLDHCLIITQFLKTRSSWNLFQYYGATTPKQAIRDTKDRFDRHFDTFELEAKDLDFDKVIHQNRELARRRTFSLTPGPQDDEGSVAGPDFEQTVIAAPCPISTFTGRSMLVDQMREFFGAQYHNDGVVDTYPEETGRLNADHNTPKCCILSGIAGIGKTETALQYAYLCRGKYDVVVLLPSDSAAKLREAIANRGTELKIANNSNGHEVKWMELFKNWLENTDQSWLLIFDNMEDLNIPNLCMPSTSKGLSSVIMTTRNSKIYLNLDTYIKLSVEPFGRNDGARLLFKCLGYDPSPTEREAGAQISELFEGVPRAIDATANHIKAKALKVEHFMPDLGKLEGEWHASAFHPMSVDHKSAVDDVDIAKAIRELSSRTRAFLNCLAFMDTGGIPIDIFRNLFSQSQLEFIQNEEEFLEDVHIHEGLQLLKKNRKSDRTIYLTLNRTLQRILLLNISIEETGRRRAVRHAIELLDSSFNIKNSIDVPDPENWPEFEKYSKQFLSVLDNFLWPAPALEPPPNFADLLSRLSTYLWHAGRIKEARAALMSVVRAYDTANIDQMDLRRSDVYSRLGIVLSFNGISDRQESLKHRRLALEIREAAYNSGKEKGSHDAQIRLFNVKSDMAFSNLHQENFPEVERIMTECLTQYKKWDEVEENIPYEYGKFYFLMSFVRMAQRDSQEALRFARRGEELMKLAATEDHPITQLWKFGLGTILYHAGKIEESWIINEQIRQARIKISGEANHFTLESYSMCGALLRILGRLDEAQAMLNRCLERVSQSGWYPEGTARTQFRLYQVYAARGKGDEPEAVKLLNKARTSAKKVMKSLSHTRSIDSSLSSDDEAVYDQMVSLWAGRMTGKLKGGAMAQADSP